MIIDDIWIIDAFTSKPFMGNAAAVCLLDAFPADAEMQLVAAQMNLSETAFAVRNKPLDYNLRWFTPDVEVNLCGHATLAATHALLQSGVISRGPTLPGEPVKPPAALKALGVDIVACELSRDNYLVEVKDFTTLLSCTPSFKKLARLDAQGVIVTTARGVEGFDFASRYFCPGIGINEDPVTGSAHCTLAPYWAKKLGKDSFHALQASKGHGILDVSVKGTRTFITGQCVTTLKGKLPTAKRKESLAC
jgi:predicted PhzF superfamily epimerase YddE/YHI9